MSTNEVKPAPLPPPKKPIEGKTIGFLLVGVLAVGVLLTSVVSLLTTSTPKAQPGEVQQPAPKPAVKQFSGDVDRAAATIANGIKQASQVSKMAAELHAELPPCDQAMRDQLGSRYYTLHSRNPELPDANLVCGADDQWQALPPTVGQIQPDTPEKMAAERSSSPSGGLSAAEKNKLRLAAIYQANPVSLHFADAQEVEPSITAPAGASPALNNDALQAPVPFAVPPQAAPAAAAVPLGVQLSSYTGARYPLFEGRIIEGLLVNRLKGDMGGFVKVQITTPVYSDDNQHLLIKPGDNILGEAVRVDVAGQQRIAVVFHRIIMDRGWSFLLDQTNALDQQGAAGLTGKVDRHLVSLITTAAVVGAIEGLSDFASFGSGSGVVQIQTGMSRESGMEAMQILRNALNRPYGITVFEGSRVKLVLAKDQALPAYENHVVTETVR